MTARILDGKATLGDDQGRSCPSGSPSCASAGVVPGSGHRPVGDDPGSHWYVNAKHKDCAEIGITSIRRDLPADARPRPRSRRSSTSSTPTRPAPAFLVQQPTGLDEMALLSRVDPERTSTGCTR